MGRLTDTATERIKANRNASLPDWVPLVGAVALVALLSWAVIGSVIGGDDIAAGGGAPPPAVPQPRPGATPPGTGGTPGGQNTTTTEPAATVELPNAVGGTDTVPTGAVEFARRVAGARVRGDVGGLPLADGADAPSITATGDTPSVVDVTVTAVGEGRYSFVVTVDPDSAGPAPSVYLSVVVVDADDGWRWDPAG